MNPGYLACVLISIVLILFVSGWKSVWMNNVSVRALVMFFAALFLLYPFHAELPNGWRINLSLVPYSALTVIALARLNTLTKIGYFVSCGVMLGSIYGLLDKMYSIDPIIVVFTPLLDIAIFFSLLTLVFTREPLEQLACITIGLLLGESLAPLFLHARPQLLFGGGAFQDRWWTIAVLTRGMSEAGAFVREGCRNALHVWLERRKGWK